MNDRRYFPIFISLVLIVLVSGCTQEDDFANQMWTEEKQDLVTQIFEESNKLETKTCKSRILSEVKPICSLQDLNSLLGTLEELKIAGKDLKIEHYVIPQVKTRSEGGSVGMRYGIRATRSGTFLTHTLDVTYTAINDDYNIENVSYNVTGFHLGEVTSEVTNTFKSSSTRSHIETTATIRWIVNGYEVRTSTAKTRWTLDFLGGSTVLVSTSEY